MILIAYGTRPEYIKVKPLIDELNKNEITFKTIFTGQHKDMVDTESDYKLNMSDTYENRLNNILIDCLKIPNSFFEKIKYIIVQGDTTSAVGLALAAINNKIKVIHLEAGLRSFDNDNPYPEEFNRKIISSISNIHLCPTKKNKQNLLNENVSEEKIFVVGNTVLDNLIDLKQDITYDNIILVTLHRRENHQFIENWFTSINQLAIDNPDYSFILPLHPNPDVSKHKKILSKVNVINPLKHNELLKYLAKCKLVITDSGGIQEECSFLRKKCLVCRKNTERPESLGTTSFIVEDFQKLKNIFDYHVLNYHVDNLDCPFGDGKSSQKIVKILKQLL